MVKIVVFEDNLLLVEISGKRITKIALKDVVYFESNKRLVDIIYNCRTKDEIKWAWKNASKLLC